MDLLTARLRDQLSSLSSEVMVMDRLAEWNRQHLESRYASAQLYDPEFERLHLVAHREFAAYLIDQFGDIPITSGTMCARAARLQTPILVPDVTADSDWAPFLSFSERAGFDSVLSVPLLSKTGEVIGVTSCHFVGCARPSQNELKFAQVSCAFASDAIGELRRRSRQ